MAVKEITMEVRCKAAAHWLLSYWEVPYETVSCERLLGLVAVALGKIEGVVIASGGSVIVCVIVRKGLHEILPL
jgi:hypothetical protein